MIRRSLLIAFGVYLLIALIITYPLILNLSTSLIGYVHGDAYEMAHHIWWIKHALQTGQHPFFAANLAYPDGINGMTLWAHPLQFFPAWLLAYVLPLPVAANVTVLITLALNGTAMFGLARYLLTAENAESAESRTKRRLTTENTENAESREKRRLTAENAENAESREKRQLTAENAKNAEKRQSTTENTENTEEEASVLSPQSSLFSSLITHHSLLLAAFLAGVVFMLYPTMQGHLGAGHAGLMVQWGVPIYVYGLYRLAEKPYRRSAVTLAALGFVLCSGGHILQLIYVVLPLTVVIALAHLLRRDWQALIRTGVAALIGSIAMLVFVLPVLSATVSTSAYEESGDTVRYSADLLAVVTPSFNHPLFGQMDFTHRVLGINLDEGALYIGVIGALLALIALIRVRAARVWGGIALLAWILALGVLLKVFDRPVTLSVDAYRTYITLPFAFAADLPIFNLARTPGRFGFLLALAVAVMVGYGARIVFAWLKRPALRWIGVLVLSAAILFEYQTFFPLPTTTATVPAGISALAERGDVRAVFGVPWDNLVAAKTDLYYQTVHNFPLIAGQVTRQTPVDPAKLNLLQTFDPALLNAAGADVVLIHRAFDDGSLERLARERLGEPFYVDNTVALFDTPAPADLPAFAAILPPEGEITNTAASIFAPGDGTWVRFDATLSGADRDLNLLRDGVLVHRWHVNGTTSVSVPLLVRNYETLRLALDPPCPLNSDPALECPTITLTDPQLEFVVEDYGTLASFVDQLYLEGSFVAPLNGNSLPVWLNWKFDRSRDENDIRFVHVIDDAGTLVGQQDNTLGVRPAGSGWMEEVLINFENPLPPGEYRVYVGWYTYPEITPFCVTNLVGSTFLPGWVDDDCLPDGATDVLLGTFRVE